LETPPGGGCDHRSVIGAHGSGGKKSLDAVFDAYVERFFSKFAVRGYPSSETDALRSNLSGRDSRFMSQHVNNGSLE
tara:strand:+ start:832 stop:1062 length:231 start_codon:yes stop_codon:yes gene_type:complete